MLLIDGETLFSREGTTQGDPLAMAMYAIATVPLIERLQQHVTQVWFADDATAGGKLLDLRNWWDQLVECGQDYGYSANASKTWLVVRPEYLDQAKEIFAESGVQITAEGRRHLGAAVGTRSFAEAFVSTKVQEWVKEIDTLTLIAQTQPHTAFAGLTHGLISKWNYLQRAIPGTGELFQPLEDAIRLNLGFLSRDQFSRDQLPRDQLSRDQLATRSTLTRSTCHKINSIFFFNFRNECLMLEIT